MPYIQRNDDGRVQGLSRQKITDLEGKPLNDEWLPDDHPEVVARMEEIRIELAPPPPGPTLADQVSELKNTVDKLVSSLVSAGVLKLSP